MCVCLNVDTVFNEDMIPQCALFWQKPCTFGRIESKKPIRMRLYFFIAALVAISACTPSAEGDEKKEKQDEFALISLSEADQKEINARFSAMLNAQSAGEFSTSLGHYLPELFESEEQFEATVASMKEYRAYGVVQTFNDFELTWASPFVESFGRQVCLLSFNVDHQIKLEGMFEEKFAAFETNVRDQYGRAYYTPDPENKRYLINGPVKFFVFKDANGGFSFLNEEFLRSPKANEFFESIALHELKAFESTARKQLGM